ncbi:MAG: hypothetical protein JJT96_10800, partial [Opitutales bacterium]|nr:hypothetical protein [Opitutales bacterium]
AAELACALFPIMPGWLGFRDCADAWAHFLHHFFQGTHVVAPGQKPNAEDPARIWQKTIRDVSVWLNWVGNLAYVPDDDFDFQLAIKLFAQERIAACTWGVLDAAFDG